MSKYLFTQIKYQVQRQLKIKMNDSFNLTISFFISPLLALLMALIFTSDPELVYNDSYPNFLFFMLVTSIFFGLLGSVFEIIKDRTVIQRERLGSISALGYYVAKYLALSFFGLIQVILFNVVAALVLHIEMPILLFNAFLMYLLLLISIAMGLWVSSLSSTLLMASNFIPILIIPQILLGGLIPYSEMDKILFMGVAEESGVPVIAKIIPGKYAYESIITGNVAFSSSVEEINDKVTEIVGFSKSGGFMSLEVEGIPLCDEGSLCTYKWFFNILVLVLYLWVLLLLGYFTFKRRVYDA